jgi:uncharacterized membrane protein
MSEPLAKQDEQQFEQFLGQFLRAGVLVSALVVLVGGVIFLVRHGQEPANYVTFAGVAPEYRHPELIVRGAWSLGGRAMIQLGLLLLIATPVLRVALSAVVFSRQRDYIYVALTALVLGVLLYGLFLDPG